MRAHRVSRRERKKANERDVCGPGRQQPHGPARAAEPDLGRVEDLVKFGGLCEHERCVPSSVK